MRLDLTHDPMCPNQSRDFCAPQKDNHFRERRTHPHPHEVRGPTHASISCDFSDFR